MIVVVWGATREAVSDLYNRLPKVECEHSVTWRLADSFTGPQGHACFAPDHPDIEDEYRDAKLRVLKEKPADDEAVSEAKPKKKARKKKPKTG